MDLSRTIWLPPDANAKTRLFCLPYAGAGASVFIGWRQFAKATAVCPVQLPGRENRVGDAPFDRMEPLVQELANVICAVDEMPFAFYGHSMGGLIAFELCQEFRRRGKAMPHALFVGACRAPQFAIPNPPIAHLPDDGFIDALNNRYGGIPDAVLKRPELLQMFLPAIRGDFSILENYDRGLRSPLDCPIVSFGGTADESISQAELEGWRDHTTAGFEWGMIEGDHFFAKTGGDVLMREIEAFGRFAAGGD